MDQTRAQAQAEVTQVRAEANQAVLHTRAAAQEEVVAAQRTALERIALLEQELLQSRREREESNRRIEQLIAERRLADDYYTGPDEKLNSTSSLGSRAQAAPLQRPIVHRIGPQCRFHLTQWPGSFYPTASRPCWGHAFRLSCWYAGSGTQLPKASAFTRGCCYQRTSSLSSTTC